MVPLPSPTTTRAANAEYHGSARYENPNNDFTDNAVDAEFEEMN